MTLQCSGYEVTAAADGEEAFGLLAHADFDLLLTDHNMPRLTGLDLIARLRATGCHVPVVLTSGVLSERDLTPSMRARIDAIITKPAGTELLLGTIRRCLGHTSADPS
jgi:CheY-like chemotaxis protein